MKRKMRLIFTFLLVAILLVFPGEALADIAPPINPPGSNLQPGEESTQVRMENEKVVLDVKDDGQEEGLGKAHVTADFNMRNLGSEAETMQVRFPISANNGWGDYPEITGVVVKVNGKTVPTTISSYPEPNYSADPVPWVEFEVTFPLGLMYRSRYRMIYKVQVITRIPPFIIYSKRALVGKIPSGRQRSSCACHMKQTPLMSYWTRKSVGQRPTRGALSMAGK